MSQPPELSGGFIRVARHCQHSRTQGGAMNILDKVDFQFDEVLDKKTQGLIRMACAVAVNCPD
jgi:hypothetical protein